MGSCAGAGDVPGNVPLNKVTVTLNGEDVTDALRPGHTPGSLEGLGGARSRQEHAEGESERRPRRGAGDRALHLSDAEEARLPSTPKR